MGEKQENDRVQKYYNRTRPTKKYPYFAIEFRDSPGNPKTYNIVSYTMDSLKAAAKYHPDFKADMLFLNNKRYFSMSFDCGGVKYTYIYPFMCIKELGEYIDTLQINFISVGSNIYPNYHLRYLNDYEKQEHSKDKKKGKKATSKVIDFEKAKSNIMKKRKES